MVTRHLYASLKESLHDKEITVLIGARQTGKSTLLQQLATELEEQNQTVYHITLEDPLILAELNIHPEHIFKFIQLLDTKIYVCIDEIQYLQNPSNFLKYIYDKYSSHIKLLVTGSSAFYIDSKFTDSLAGRKKLFELYTLRFEEFLEFKQLPQNALREYKAIQKNDEYISLMRNQIQILFDEYITFGGYPAVVLEQSFDKKIEKIKELLNSYIKRDIQESGIQNTDAFYKLMQLLASQTGSLVNVHELSKTVGISVTAVNHCLFVLQKCFHIQLVKPFYKNLKKELTKMPKVYFNDVGLRNGILNQFEHIPNRLDKGELIENYAFTRLRDVYSTEAIHFWRTSDGKEVDFVIDTHSCSRAIEVKFNDANYRESKYTKFKETYNHISFEIFTYEWKIPKHSILRL